MKQNRRETRTSIQTETQAVWFARRLAEIYNGLPTPRSEHFFPIGVQKHGDRELGVLASPLAHALFSFHVQVKYRGRKINPTEPEYDNLMQENESHWEIARGAFQAQLRAEFSSSLLQLGERFELRRRWIVVAAPALGTAKKAPPEVQIPHPPVNLPPEDSSDNPLLSVLTIVHHLGVLKKILGPELGRILKGLGGQSEKI